MTDRFDALRKALEGKDDQSAWSWFCSSASFEDIAAIRALLAERDALKADAERLDWLESRNVTTCGNSDEEGCKVVITSLEADGPNSVISHHERLRPAIDAARNAEEK